MHRNHLLATGKKHLEELATLQKGKYAIANPKAGKHLWVRENITRWVKTTITANNNAKKKFCKDLNKLSQHRIWPVIKKKDD